MRDVDGSAVLFDGAHNGHGAEALAAAFVAAFPERPAVLIALKKGKDAAAVLAPIARIASRLLFTTLPGTPGYDPEELAQLAPSGLPCEVVRDPDAALLLLAKAGGRPGMALCCGSLYLVGYYLARLGRGAD
jgi:dihydrofolate synthase/folylpolyglutamate synthase